MSDPVAELLERIAEGRAGQVVLVGGDLVLAEPAGRRIAGALAQRFECEPQTLRRPPSLAETFADLRTFSLFGGGKVRVVVESALLADRHAAADLIDQAGEWSDEGEGELSAAGREAAGRLLQALRVFGVEAGALNDPVQILGSLPDWAFAGGQAFRKKRRNRGRGKKQVAELRSGLETLLHRAVDAGLVGFAESDAAELGALLEGGLPEGHALVLVESSLDADHPLVRRLRDDGQVVQLGGVGMDRRGGIEGAGKLAQELQRETGVRIEADAMRELVHRTLRKTAGTRDQVDARSTSRLAAEYRKLATLAEDRITLALVRDNVEDRGEEDVWKFLDAVAAGSTAEALDRMHRLLDSAPDRVGARLSTFSLLADLCRQMVAMQGLLDRFEVRPGERNYRRFKDRIAPRLQQSLPDGSEHLLQRFHPYRLHRVYLAASARRHDPGRLSRILWRVLQTEARLKGESGDPDVALAELVATVGETRSTTARAGAR